ncbi:ABC transporter permease subunit [Rossellomorea aquimaris]|uniref:ABC transporter permease n=1 Tax=Rossellomorea TaxID=2837508 RepID=UPI001CD419BB|nr:ABC transporter permease subunit [Rossellomorea aquimaris]MCA1061523.1 ABC transporter permease subunit [Rossellomorea aquimaris]
MKWLKVNNAFLILPGVLFFLLIPGLGIVLAIFESVRDRGTFTFAHYQELIVEDRFISSVLFSLMVTSISTILALVIGLGIVKAFSPLLKDNKHKLLVWIPMLVPHFVWAYLVYLLFNQSGFFSNVAGLLGWIDDRSQFPIVVQDRNGVGIILTYVWKEVPFVTLMMLPVYATLSKRYKEVASLLGAGPYQAFWVAEWPLIFPVFIETGAILFAFIFTAFEVPQLLGVTSPQMLAILAYDWFYSGSWSDRPLAFASLVLTGLVIGIIMWVVLYMTNKKRMHITKGIGN